MILMIHSVKKIRSVAITKIPNLLIVGEKEQADKTVTWQRYGNKERQTLAFDAFLTLLQEEILQRRDWRTAGQT